MSNMTAQEIVEFCKNHSGWELCAAMNVEHKDNKDGNNKGWIIKKKAMAELGIVESPKQSGTRRTPSADKESVTTLGTTGIRMLTAVSVAELSYRGELLMNGTKGSIRQHLESETPQLMAAVKAVWEAAGATELLTADMETIKTWAGVKTDMERLKAACDKVYNEIRSTYIMATMDQAKINTLESRGFVIIEPLSHIAAININLDDANAKLKSLDLTGLQTILACRPIGEYGNFDGYMDADVDRCIMTNETEVEKVNNKPMRRNKNQVAIA